MVLIVFEVGSGQFWSVLREGVSFKVRTPRTVMMKMMMMMKPRPSDNVGLSEERAQPRLLRPITLHKRNNHQHRPPGSTLELPSNGPVFNERLRDETKAQKHWVIRPNLPTPRSPVLLPSFLLWFYSASAGQRRSEQEDVFIHEYSLWLQCRNDEASHGAPGFGNPPPSPLHLTHSVRLLILWEARKCKWIC